MLNIHRLTDDLMVEEDELRTTCLTAIRSEDTSHAELAILDCLLAIHKRQRHGIILGLRS